MCVYERVRACERVRVCVRNITFSAMRSLSSWVMSPISCVSGEEEVKRLPDPGKAHADLSSV
jgi:hypothetical protein